MYFNLLIFFSFQIQIKKDGKVVSAALINSAISPIRTNNPSFRIYDLISFGESYVQLADYRQRYMDIQVANAMVILILIMILIFDF